MTKTFIFRVFYDGDLAGEMHIVDNRINIIETKEDAFNHGLYNMKCGYFQLPKPNVNTAITFEVEEIKQPMTFDEFYYNVIKPMPNGSSVKDICKKVHEWTVENEKLKRGHDD
ncbi:MAG: hypothetical protein P8X74_03875 [Reinekea sp.]